MKYRFKIDNPFGGKGTIVSPNANGLISNGLVSFFPEGYPDLLEEIPEPNPVEKVAKWLWDFWSVDQVMEFYSPKTTQAILDDLATKLLAAGLDPERLK